MKCIAPFLSKIWRITPAANAPYSLRSEHADGIEDILFMLMMLGDDRAVRATYVAGACVHQRDIP